MDSLPQLVNAKGWAQEKALVLDEIMHELAAMIERDHTLREAAGILAVRYHGRAFNRKDGVHLLSLSESGLVTKYYLWMSHGRSFTAFLPHYKGNAKKVPTELIQEIHRRCTLPGMVNSSPVFTALEREWASEKEVPGLGTWKTWWSARYPSLPVPDKAPDFPFSRQTLYKYLPDRKRRVRGNLGKAAAAGHMPHLTLNYSNLKPCELFVFDDVRLDLVGVDDSTGFTTEVKAYIAIEAGTRYVPAFVLRPSNAFIAQDIDELVVHTLTTMGLCQDGTTKLLFERGTLTMSPESGKILHKVSGGRIAVIRTGMDAEVTFVGAPREAGKGHWMGKAVIESFMAKFRLILMTLDGQRGNSYANQPGNLGHVGHGLRPRPGTLAAEAEKLAAIDMAFNRRLRLDCGLMWVSEIRAAVAQAIRDHNNEPGCQYQGQGYTTQEQVAPGVWEDRTSCLLT